jgi:hypothetical protein
MAARDLPPDLAAVKTLPDMLKAATFALDLRADDLLRVTLETDRADSAATLHKLLESGLTLARQFYPQAREELARQLPPEAAPALLAIADQLHTGVTVTQDGERVTVVLKRPDNVPAALPR